MRISDVKAVKLRIGVTLSPGGTRRPGTSPA